MTSRVGLFLKRRLYIKHKLYIKRKLYIKHKSESDSILK